MHSPMLYNAATSNQRHPTTGVQKTVANLRGSNLQTMNTTTCPRCHGRGEYEFEQVIEPTFNSVLRNIDGPVQDSILATVVVTVSCEECLGWRTILAP